VWCVGRGGTGGRGSLERREMELGKGVGVEGARDEGKGWRTGEGGGEDKSRGGGRGRIRGEGES